MTRTPDRFREDRDESLNARQAIEDDPMGPDREDLRGERSPTAADVWFRGTHPEVEAAYEEAERRGMVEYRRRGA